MTAREFEVQLNREFAEKKEELHEAVTLISLYALNGVVMKSPVDTGRFRGNWNVAIGAPDMTTTENVDPSGGETIQRGGAVIATYSSLDNFPPVFLTNNLPYAVRLEDGYSKQAPGGMVGLTVAEINARFDGMVV